MGELSVNVWNAWGDEDEVMDEKIEMEENIYLIYIFKIYFTPTSKINYILHKYNEVSLFCHYQSLFWLCWDSYITSKYFTFQVVYVFVYWVYNGFILTWKCFLFFLNVKKWVFIRGVQNPRTFVELEPRIHTKIM